MIKIISGHSLEGGSTEILINLTNLFNENGYDCTFYGLHDFHLDKCKSEKLENLVFKKNDIVISHILQIEGRPKDAKKVIYYCHEKWWWKRLDEIVNYWDIAVFSHEEHRNYHSGYTGPSTWIPNPKSDLVYKDKPELDKVAAVIGTIEDRKQTHLSIENALNDGCEKIFIYGANYRDPNYYRRFVKKYETHPYVKFMGHAMNKQEMYDNVGRVYHHSKGEVACLVKDECYQTGTKFFGTGETTHEVSKLTNKELLEVWVKLLEL